MFQTQTLRADALPLMATSLSGYRSSERQGALSPDFLLDLKNDTIVCPSRLRTGPSRHLVFQTPRRVDSRHRSLESHALNTHLLKMQDLLGSFRNSTRPPKSILKCGWRCGSPGGTGTERRDPCRGCGRTLFSASPLKEGDFLEVEAGDGQSELSRAACRS